MTTQTKTMENKTLTVRIKQCSGTSDIHQWYADKIGQTILVKDDLIKNYTVIGEKNKHILKQDCELVPTVDLPYDIEKIMNLKGQRVLIHCPDVDQRRQFIALLHGNVKVVDFVFGFLACDMPKCYFSYSVANDNGYKIAYDASDFLAQNASNPPLEVKGEKSEPKRDVIFFDSGTKDGIVNVPAHSISRPESDKPHSEQGEEKLSSEVPEGVFMALQTEIERFFDDVRMSPSDVEGIISVKNFYARVRKALEVAHAHSPAPDKPTGAEEIAAKAKEIAQRAMKWKDDYEMCQQAQLKYTEQHTDGKKYANHFYDIEPYVLEILTADIESYAQSLVEEAVRREGERFTEWLLKDYQASHNQVGKPSLWRLSDTDKKFTTSALYQLFKSKENKGK